MINIKSRCCLALTMLAAMALVAPQAMGEGNDTSPVQAGPSGDIPVVDIPVGELLYSDDFSSSKSGWPIFDDGFAKAFYRSGGYHVSVFPEDYWQPIDAPRANYTDFVLEVEASKEEGPDDNVYGVYTRGIESGSYYAFLISSDGYFDFQKKEKNNWTAASNWTKSSAINTGDAKNVITVMCRENRFGFYANGQKLGEYTDDSFPYGGLGLYAGTQAEGNLTIGFDNLKVWSIKEE